MRCLGGRGVWGYRILTLGGGGGCIKHSLGGSGGMPLRGIFGPSRSDAI